MHNPFVRAILILFIACIISQGLFMYLDKGVQKFNVFTNQKLSEMFEKDTPFDLLAIGSSRALSHIHPTFLDSVLAVNAFNAGMAGANIMEIKTAYWAYLATHKTAPKYVLLNIDRRTLNDLDKYYNNNIYYPYLSNEVLDSMMQIAGIKTYFYRYLPFTQFFEYDDYMRNIGVQGHRNKTEIQAENTYFKGFMSLPQHKVFKPAANEKLTFEGAVTCKGIGLLVDILERCKRDNTQLIFLFTPELHEKMGVYPPNMAVKTVDSLASIYGLKVLRYDNLDDVYPPADFADKGHLNGAAANRFSLQLAKDLQPIIKTAK